jgi:NAD(P)-dependent dehydrogenase (short-subunit alcohol dehydrogenase family)
MDINLNDKVAVITGGTAGIGLATAELFAREGAEVAICSRKESNVEKALAYLGEKGLKAYGEAVDVSDRSTLFGFADRVEKEFGGIDVWVSNAGIFIQKKIIDTSDDLWQNVMDINLKSVFYGGHTVGSGAYAASKAAVGSMTKSLAAELAPFNIRVVGFIPGIIDTAMTEPWIRAKGEILAGQAALQRIGEPAEVANALLFLASDKASFVTGICMEITGGKFCVQNPQDAWE